MIYKRLKIKRKKFAIFFLILLFLFSIKYSIIYNLDNNSIKVAYYCHSIKNGGVEQVVSLLINYLSHEKNFSLYLITESGLLEGEYFIPNTTKRIYLSEYGLSLFSAIKHANIDILVYNFYNEKEIKKLNKLKKTKIIFYNHSSFLYWIYMNKYEFRKTIYNIYKKCNYIISLIPIENDYLFKKWGINSILLDNPTTFKYDFVIPSDLSKKNIIMIGRADDPIKRYDLGIKAMTSILKEIPDSQMNILSKINEDYQKLIENLSLEKNVRFVDYQQNITLFLKKSSLHLLTSLAESYSMVLSETKIFGIPSIICGLDYLALSKEGTIIIYDDNPDTIAKEAITILKDDKYRQRLGLQARNSMKKHQNNLITKKWVKLLFAVYKGDIESYKELQESSNKISEIEVENILNNQLNLLKKRIPQFREITLEQLKAYHFS